MSALRLPLGIGMVGASVGFPVRAEDVESAGLSYWCRKAETEIVIDGDLSEWSNAASIRLVGDGHVRKSSWKGPADLSAVVQSMWNEANLYLAVTVNDDVHLPIPEADELGSMWKWDAIQLAFDMESNASTAGYDDDDCEIGFCLTAAGPRGYCWHGRIKHGRIPLELVVGSIRCSGRRDDERKRTVYEIAIPWDKLLLSGRPPRQFGFNIVVVDRDGGGNDGYLEWTRGIFGGKDPRFFGTFRITDQPPVAESTPLRISLSSKEVFSDDDASVRVLCTIESSLARAASIRATLSPREGESQTKAAALQVKEGASEHVVEFPTTIPDGEYGLEVVVEDETGALLASRKTAFQKLTRLHLDQRLARLKVDAESLKTFLDDAAAKTDTTYASVTLHTALTYVNLIVLDLQAKELMRAKLSLNYLEPRLRKVRAEVQAAIQAGRLASPFPRYDPGQPVETRNGEFYQNGRPVIFTGVVNPGDLMDGYQGVPRYGFNAVCSSMDPEDMRAMTHTLPTAGVVEDIKSATAHPDREPFARVKRMVGVARDLGLGLFLIQYPYRIPEWALELHPELKIDDICNPHFRKLVESYLRISLTNQKAITPTKNLFYIAESKEDGPPVHLSQYTLARFREWLRQKYGGEIGRLNAAQRMNYASFEAIGWDEYIQKRSPMWIQLQRFHQWYYGQHIAWQREIMREINPTVKVGASFITYYCHDSIEDFGRPMDLDSIFGPVDFAAVDTDIQYPTPSADPLMHGSIVPLAMWYDLVKSRYPDRPVVDPEWHLFNLTIPYPLNHAQAIMWQGYLHGLSGGLIWKGYRGPDYSALLYQPWLLEGCGRTALDAQRLAPVIEAFHNSPKEVAIFYSPDSFAWPGYWDSVRQIYRSTFFLDAPVTFFSERQTTAENLRPYKLLIFPMQSRLSAEGQEQVQAWLDRGGTVVLIGNALQNYPDHSRRPDELSGKVVRWEETLSDDQAAASFDVLYEKLAVRRPIRTVDPARKRRDGIECRVATLQGKRVFYLLNLTKQACEVVIVQNGKPCAGKLTDLLTGETLVLKRGRARLESLEFRLLRKE